MSSKRIPKPRKREFFASPFTVAATVGSILFFLYLIFPKQSLMELLSTPRKSDPLVRDYLATLLQVDPGNRNIRLLLARQEIAFGNFARAKQLISPLRSAESPAIRWEALWTTYEITFNETFTHREQSPMRLDGLAQLRKMLAEMADGPWEKAQLERLARDSLALGSQQAAFKFSARLSGIEKTPKSAADSARMALAGGEYRRSAEFYFLAMSRETTLEGRRKWFIAALKSLQAGNLPEEALAAGEKHLSGLGNDRDTLMFMARLALAAGKGRIAQSYLKRLLNFTG